MTAPKRNTTVPDSLLALLHDLTPVGQSQKAVDAHILTKWAHKHTCSTVAADSTQSTATCTLMRGYCPDVSLTVQTSRNRLEPAEGSKKGASKPTHAFLDWVSLARVKTEYWTNPFEGLRFLLSSTADAVLSEGALLLQVAPSLKSYLENRPLGYSERQIDIEPFSTARLLHPDIDDTTDVSLRYVLQSEYSYGNSVITETFKNVRLDTPSDVFRLSAGGWHYKRLWSASDLTAALCDIGAEFKHVRFFSRDSVGHLWEVDPAVDDQLHRVDYIIAQ